MPPIAGLHDICAIRSTFIVIIAVFKPIRAHARAASHPACPAPITATSNCSCIVIIVASVNILLIGGGGREPALAWRLAQSPSRPKLFVAPGNPGIARVAPCLPVANLASATLLAAARSASADLTVVGPEAPLVNGVVDAFRAAGRLIVGPTAAAARLEGSKVYAKQFFAANGIPTAHFEAVSNAQRVAVAFRRFGFPLVVKTDGLAAGKGVIIAHTQAEAEAAYLSLSPTAVVEEFLTGEEVSF